jgi:1-acyl-sn-glycerol-3-phosphate acyltransferase
MAREEHILVDQARPTGWRGWVYRTAVNLAAALGRVFLYWRVEGAENIPRTGPLLVVANHPSYLDPPSLVALMIYHADRDVSIMAWDKLFNIPFVGFFTRSYKAYPVNRNNPGRGPYVTLLRIMQSGGAAGVFPEGSRSKGQLMGEWKPGALRAALATKATILPVTFQTVGEFWPRDFWRPRFFRRHVQIVHKPLRYEEYMADLPEGLRERDFQDHVAARIRDIINGPLIERRKQWEAHIEARLRAAETLQSGESMAGQRAKRLEEARKRLTPAGNADSA